MTAGAAGGARVYVVRHGETAWSLNGRHTGRTDIPLNALGEREAAALEPCLRSLPFAHVFTSPRERARRTCQLAGLAANAAIDSDLSEWDYGQYEGERSADIHATRPDWSLFRDGAPGGETPAMVGARADRLIARLRALGGLIALFSHGHFTRVLAARWVGLPVLAGQHLAVATASIGVLGFEPAHPETATIELWNMAPSPRLASLE